jgi:hypothetical protein
MPMELVLVPIPGGDELTFAFAPAGEATAW